MPLGVDQRARYFRRALEHRGQLDEFVAQVNFSGVDASDIEQIVDDVSEMPGLVPDRVMRSADCRSVGARHFQDFQRRQDRRQRVSQLVAEHGKEFVFALIGFRELFESALQCCVGFLVLVDLGLQRSRLLLQFCDRAMPFIGARQREVTFSGNDVRMLGTYLEEGRAVHMPREAVYRVSAA